MDNHSLHESYYHYHHQRSRSLPIVIPSSIQKLQSLDNWLNANSEIIAIIITKLQIVNECQKNDEDDYMFKIQVELIDRTCWFINRSYSQLHFWYHSQLLQIFPIEGGVINDCYERQIPELPKRPPWLLSFITGTGREKRQKEMIKRVRKWLVELLKIQPYISRSKIFVSFWLPTDKDSEKRMDLHHRHHEQEESILSKISNESKSITTTMAMEGKKQRIKVKALNNEIYMIDYPMNSGINNLRELLKAKDAIDCNEFTFIDDEGDLIVIVDDEDLDIAIGNHKVTNINIV